MNITPVPQPIHSRILSLLNILFILLSNINPCSFWHYELFEADLYEEIALETCVSKRISKGGTSVASVEAQIAYVRKGLEA